MEQGGRKDAQWQWGVPYLVQGVSWQLHVLSCGEKATLAFQGHVVPLLLYLRWWVAQSTIEDGVDNGIGHTAINGNNGNAKGTRLLKQKIETSFVA